jgi:hypothetical protein
MAWEPTTTFENVLKLPLLRQFACFRSTAQEHDLRIHYSTPLVLYEGLLRRIEASPELYLLCRLAVNACKYADTDMRQSAPHHKRYAKVHDFLAAWRAELLAALAVWFELDETQHAACRKRIKEDAQEFVTEGRKKARERASNRRAQQRQDQMALRHRAAADAVAREQTTAMKRARGENNTSNCA